MLLSNEDRFADCAHQRLFVQPVNGLYPNHFQNRDGLRYTGDITTQHYPVISTIQPIQQHDEYADHIVGKLPLSFHD